MKKTYISPAMLTVQLSATCLVVESLRISSTNTITDESEILVKENTVRDVNLWDEEW